MEQSSSPDRDPDPFRAQLDARWNAYLATHTQAADHGEWMNEAMGDYRDEIVHFGGQLLNDVAIREWNHESAQRAHDKYVTEAERYDRDPAAWEAAFWLHVRAGSDDD
ncbi:MULTISPECIES: hypothetical protein [unclassified Rathayibacter]|jgi:hypothetical protein|uniref:hypothetical protein n=1 Tax=unclassified Rathayibacter TaxID=2609250 RepID=UPI000CE74106|nr:MULTISPECIES: hypothetical protein [unclassified Rathayibacter]PPF25715.1 hypothetical protein C5C54_14530 [Rathayibacter sp. AY1F2]PPH16183.1 hypothetical protein C5C35_11370 [Rathayibacter sp. AY1F8]PPH21510.1 hypothetical protein C5C99_06215 [Rathayibacter sp. AY1C4]PPH43659.1 hypothetical protein C5C42_13255 [Rathayibacter sp. AY1F7]PPH71282.1 hypothetical protein C5C90_14680 [Rathayibacter sp. AY1D4]